MNPDSSIQQDNRTLAEKARSMDNQELVSRLCASWHYAEDLRRRAEYDKAEKIMQEEFFVFRGEAESRMR